MNHRIMRLGALALFVGSIAPSGAFARPARGAAELSKAFALTHVTVIDCVSAEAKPDMTVVVRDGTIVAVGKSTELTAPADVTSIDARGKFLIPGLWDMHAHCDDPRVAAYRVAGADRKELLPLFTARGVTGLRDMGCEEPSDLTEWRDEVEQGRSIFPRLFIAGGVIDGAQSPVPGARECSTAEEARKSVAKAKSRGSDFVKIYSGLSPECYQAIAGAAKGHGITFAGRVPHSVTNIEAANAGQASLEFMLGMIRDCGDVEAARAAVQDLDPEMHPSEVLAVYNGVLLDTQSPEKERALIEALVKNKTAVTPVLIAGFRQAAYEEERARMSARFASVPAALREAWQPENNYQLKDRAPTAAQVDRRAHARLLTLVGAMSKAGVRILAGSDAGAAPLCVPGESLHEELALLVQAGLTPLQALRAATRDAAEFLGRSDRLGTIEAGKQADLVLLNADPLADIRNTAKIEAVVMHGSLLDKDYLAQCLAITEPAADAGAASK